MPRAWRYLAPRLRAGRRLPAWQYLSISSGAKEPGPLSMGSACIWHGGCLPDVGGMMKINGLRCLTLFAAVSLGAVVASAQEAGSGSLNLPPDPQFLGKEDPTIRKATAIVNGDVLTATDLDQRMALYLLGNQNRQI